MPTTTEQAAQTARVIAALPPGGAVREAAMFGSRAIMLEERMLVAVWKDGSLLVRVDPERSAELCARPGAQQAVMGPGGRWDAAGSPSRPPRSPRTRRWGSGSRRRWSSTPAGREDGA